MFWLLSAALADIPATDRWLSSDHVAVGVYPDASFVNDQVGLGLLYDADGPEGPAPLGGDLLLVGNAFEVWSVEYDGPAGPTALLNGGPYTTSALAFDWDAVGATDTLRWLHGTAETADGSFEAWIELSLTADILWARLDIHATAPLSDLRFARVVDPDLDYGFNGSYDTVNDAGAEAGGDAVGWARGQGAATGRTLALAVQSGGGGLCSWCTWPEEVQAASQGPATGDYQLGVQVSLGDVAAGETGTVTFAYGLDANPDTALELAVEASLSDDHDGDGVDAHAPEAADCDDRDATVYPAAPELPDALDNDCDGAVDELTSASDEDGDGWSEADGDCDDADPDVHPDASASAAAVDADCDGVADTGWVADVPEDQAGTLPDTDTATADTGCTTSPTARSGLVSLLALLLLARRRA